MIFSDNGDGLKTVVSPRKYMSEKKNYLYEYERKELKT